MLKPTKYMNTPQQITNTKTITKMHVKLYNNCHSNGILIKVYVQGIFSYVFYISLHEKSLFCT